MASASPLQATVPPARDGLFHCFDTALGCCAIAWGAQGILASQLPESDPAATRARLQARLPAARLAEPDPEIARAIDAVQRLLDGRSSDHRELLALRLDMSGLPDFERQVLSLTREIPVGQIRSYGEIARVLGRPGAARAVGHAQGRNPFAPIVPCHRVMGHGGAAVGFSAHGGLSTKLRLLAIEARATGQCGAEQLSMFD